MPWLLHTILSLWLLLLLYCCYCHLCCMLHIIYYSNNRQLIKPNTSTIQSEHTSILILLISKLLQSLSLKHKNGWLNFDHYLGGPSTPDTTKLTSCHLNKARHVLFSAWLLFNLPFVAVKAKFANIAEISNKNLFNVNKMLFNWRLN